MKKKILILMLLCVCITLFSQENKKVRLHYKLTFGSDRALQLDSIYSSSSAGEIQFSDLKFYISKIRFLKKSRVVFEVQNSFHLLDIQDVSSLNFLFSAPSDLSFDQLVFDLGIDSLINSSGVMGGALDPSKGMYWTWQSGYINVKLEGKCSNCKSRKNEFQLHLGGYEANDNALQTIQIEVNNNPNIVLILDLEKFINRAALPQRDHIMSPGIEAVKLTASLKDCFTLAAP